MYREPGHGSGQHSSPTCMLGQLSHKKVMYSNILFVCVSFLQLLFISPRQICQKRLGRIWQSESTGVRQLAMLPGQLPHIPDLHQGPPSCPCSRLGCTPGRGHFPHIVFSAASVPDGQVVDPLIRFCIVPGRWRSLGLGSSGGMPPLYFPICMILPISVLRQSC